MVIQVALKNKAKESATILDGSVLQDYNKSIQRYNPKLKNILGKFGESEMQLTGASDLMLVYLANSGFLLKDARLATREDLETAISKANDFLSGFYVNCGLNLVTGKDGDYQINRITVEALAKDLKKVGIKLKNAKLIPYNILTYKINKKSPEGLVFKLSEEGKDTAKKLVSNTDDFKWDYKSYTSGLFRAYLSGYGGWGADCGDLACSGGGGRVVVITGEASSLKLLDRYVSKYKEDRNKAIADVNKKYAEMEASLRVA